MREILFRGKASNPVIKNKWVYGSYFEKIKYGTGTALLKKPTLIVSEPEKSSGIAIVDVYKSTVGEYTGLTDKNGKKIFEGDIVRTHYANAPKAVFVETVVFDGGKFCATSTNEGCKTTAALWDGVPRLAIDKSVYMDEVEIIGNIHDNPELLEVKE